MLCARALLLGGALLSLPPVCAAERWYYDGGGREVCSAGGSFTGGAGRAFVGWPDASRAGWGRV
eukprot:9140086-Pyramimonas_sp.AAC.1